MRYAQQDKMLDRARHELASIHAESAADRMNDEHRDADYQTVAMLASEREKERDYAEAAPLWRRAARELPRLRRGRTAHKTDPRPVHPGKKGRPFLPKTPRREGLVCRVIIITNFFYNL